MKLTTKNQRRRRQAGLTLPEVLVSLALMGLATAGMINGHLFASRQNMRTGVANEIQMEVADPSHDPGGY